MNSSKWSKSFLFTLKDAPADAEIASHKLMVRGGYIKKVGPGLYSYGPFALRAIRKFESIVRQELDRRGCQELLLPIVHPKELWEETNRWSEMGAGLLKFKNRNEHEFCLGATHEEVITDFVRRDVKSYRNLPATLYQVQTKYRDEIRPRFGLLRGREFIMKDAYSFDLTKEDAQKSYIVLREAYKDIFTRLGLDFRIVAADSGNIGGNQSEEFHILAEAGEDQLLVADQGDFAANIEVCPTMAPKEAPPADALKDMEQFPTPGLKTIADLAKSLKLPESALVKTLFFSKSEDPKKMDAVCVLVRGSDEVNPVKIKNHFGMANPPLLLTDEEVKQVTGAAPGSCGPVGLKIPILMDHALNNMKNFTVGANKDDFHLKNVNFGRDFKPTAVGDFRFAKSGDLNPKGAGALKAFRGIEVGHVFYLGTKYSKKMEAQYLDPSGNLLPIEMGCYGIGISRTVQAAVEQSNDADGIIWPLSIAPFAVHICLLDPQDANSQKVCEQIEKQVSDLGLDVFIDDREERPGVKFKDADLLGMPLRINIGARGLQNNEIDVVVRKGKASQKLQPQSIKEWVSEWLKGQKK